MVKRVTSTAVQILQRERALIAERLEGLQAQLREQKAALRSIDEALGVLGGAPYAGPKVSISGQSLKDTIHSIIRSHDGISSHDIGLALAQAGRLTDGNTILGTLSRLKREESIHKRNKVWFDGRGDVSADESDDENEEAPVSTGASQKFGDVAELEDHGAVESTQVAQHPVRNRENVGSSPTVFAQTAQRLMSSASPLRVQPSTPKPPWQR